MCLHPGIANADVMNLSLGESRVQESHRSYSCLPGGASGWSSSPSSVVAARLAEKGYVMCIAAYVLSVILTVKLTWILEATMVM